jgi:hypothetical protein
MTMGGGSIHSGNFVTFTNSLYGTPEAMAVSAPIAIHRTPRSQFLWGAYQKRVVPHRGLWPVLTSSSGGTVNTFDTYKRVIDLQRASLVHLPNTHPLAPDEPHHVPPTKLDLLDEAVRKVFYSVPPIPFEVSVHVASGSAHDVELDWVVDAAGKPVLLKLRIYCPVATGTP